MESYFKSVFRKIISIDKCGGMTPATNLKLELTESFAATLINKYRRMIFLLVKKDTHGRVYTHKKKLGKKGEKQNGRSKN